ncbi:hypothetical protein JTB14_019654 [Gonioctena quinquepunctata]|nr:hypothetical protein JTB14_019654 [Gonioctena quinquepunctata]
MVPLLESGTASVRINHWGDCLPGNGASQKYLPPPLRTPTKLLQHHQSTTRKSTKRKAPNRPYLQIPESVKKLIDNHSLNIPLNSQQLENFIENSYGCKNLLALANDYINEPQKIITMLEEIRPQLTDKKIKTRCTKLKTKLLKLITPGTIDAESDSSTYDSSTY